MKQHWLDAAEVFDAWRVAPRIVLFGYCAWLVEVIDRILTWYQHLSGAERTLEASGLAGAVITAVTGIAAWVFKIYTAGGRNWEKTSADSTDPPA